MDTLKMKDSMAALKDTITIARSMISVLSEKIYGFENFVAEAEFKLLEAEKNARKLNDAIQKLNHN